MIWIGTSGRGLDRFDPETERFTHYRHDPADPQSLSHDYIWSIVEDSGAYSGSGPPPGGSMPLTPEERDLHAFPSRRDRPEQSEQ